MSRKYEGLIILNTKLLEGSVVRNVETKASTAFIDTPSCSPVGVAKALVKRVVNLATHLAGLDELPDGQSTRRLRCWFRQHG